MHTSLFIARKYFISSRKHKAINIVSLISMASIAVGTAALIVVLSVFNGFESLIVSLYNSFDPGIKITASHGKFLTDGDKVKRVLDETTGVNAYSFSLEENVLVKYKDRQFIATLKGVDERFGKVSDIQNMISEGAYTLHSESRNMAVIGSGIAYYLKLNLNDLLSQVEIYAPRKDLPESASPEQAFNRSFVSPSGVFSIQQEYDSKYLLVSLDLARSLFERDDEFTSVEIRVAENVRGEELKNTLSAKLGNDYKIQTRLEQHQLLYRIMQSEKWVVFLILAFILAIATFNVVGSLSMLIIEKRKDISVLYCLGASRSLVRKIFLAESLMLVFAGALTGLVAGFMVCWVQQIFGIVRLAGSGTFIIDAYPVKMILNDFAYVFSTVLFIGLAASWYPSQKLITGTIDLQSVTVND